jgi:hypothetical protein
MPDEPISQRDIKTVSEKLDTLQEVLSTSQRAFLLAIFDVAARTINSPRTAAAGQRPAPIATVQDPLSSLREEFVKAFTPGEATDAEYTFSITIGPPPPVGPPPEIDKRQEGRPEEPPERPRG